MGTVTHRPLQHGAGGLLHRERAMLSPLSHCGGFSPWAPCCIVPVLSQHGCCNLCKAFASFGVCKLWGAVRGGSQLAPFFLFFGGRALHGPRNSRRGLHQSVLWWQGEFHKHFPASTCPYPLPWGGPCRARGWEAWGWGVVYSSRACFLPPASGEAVSNLLVKPDEPSWSRLPARPGCGASPSRAPPAPRHRPAGSQCPRAAAPLAWELQLCRARAAGIWGCAPRP